MLAEAQMNPQNQGKLKIMKCRPLKLINVQLIISAPRPNVSVPGAAPGSGPMPGPGGQTPHGSFVPGQQFYLVTFN